MRAKKPARFLAGTLVLLIPFIVNASLVSATPDSSYNVGDAAFLKGTYIQVGVAGNGRFGTRNSDGAVVPTGKGFFPNVGTNLGFRADRDRNGTFDDGDFFLPGGDFEGWAVNVDGTNSNFDNSNNLGAGTLSTVNVDSDKMSVVYTHTVSGLDIEQTYSVPIVGGQTSGDQQLSASVKITNSSGSNKSDVYFLRAVDPDNNQSQGCGFATNQTLRAQYGISSSTYSLVSAEQADTCLNSGARTGSTSSYIGLFSGDPRSSVGFWKSSFGSVDARSFKYNYNTSSFTYAVGSTLSADSGIGLTFSLGAIAAGETKTFSYAYVMSSQAATQAVAAASAPAAPSATPGDSQASISWSQPTSADPIVGYRIRYSTNSGSTWTTYPTDFRGDSAPRSQVVTSLTNGTEHIFQVAALTGNIDSSPTVGSWSSSSISVIPGGALAPTINSITPGNQKLTVAFTAPTETGGFPITDYEYSTNGGVNWTSSASTSSPIVITNLTNSTTYQVKVRAVGQFTGVPSSATAGTPAPTAPAAPGISAVTASDGSLSIQFTAPTDNGGATISNYKYSTDGSNYRAISPSSTTSPISISYLSSNGTTRLTNGTSYPITIKAVNSSGDSVASNSVSAVPGGSAQAPTSLTTSVSNSRIEVGFTGVSGSGLTGGTLVRYEYQVNSGSWVGIGTNTSFTANGLTNGTSYSFKVRAITRIGSTDFDGAIATITGTPNIIPINTVLPTLLGTEVIGETLTSNVQTWTGVGNIYTYQWQRADSGTQSFSNITGAVSATYVLASADLGKILRLKVTATNSAGASFEYTDPTATIRDVQTLSNFTNPGTKAFSTNSTLISVESDKGLLASFTTSTPTICSVGTGTLAGSTTSATVTFLSAGSCVISANQSGSSLIAPAILPDQTFDIGLSAPSAARNVTTSVSGTKITTNWLAPENNGGSPISRYSVTATGGGATFTCETASTTCEILGLPTGITYDVTVTTLNTTVGSTPGISGTASNAIRTLVPSSTSSKTAGSLPDRVIAKPVTSFLGSIATATQTALINSGVIAPPPSVPIVNVAANLSTGSINTATSIVVSQTVESGSQIDLAVNPPSDTPVGTAVYGSLHLAEGKVFDLGQIGITSANLATGFSLSPFAILPLGNHYVELKFGQPIVTQSFTSQSYSIYGMNVSTPTFITTANPSQITVRFDINIIAGPNGVPRVQNATPTPTPTPTPSVTPTPTPTPEPSTQAAAEPPAVIDPRGLEVVNPLAEAPAAVAQTTLTAVTLVAAVTAAASAATAVAAAAGAAASAGAAAAGGAAGASGGSSGGSTGGGSASRSSSGGGSSSGGSSSGSSSNSSGSSGGGSAGGGEGSEEGEASIEGVDFEHEGFETSSVAWGDNLKVWSIPVVTALDEPSHKATEKLAPITPLVSKLISDGAYLKAMFGSLALALPVIGMVLGLIGVVQSDGVLLPPSAPVVTAIALIGIFDALAGFLAMAVFTVGIGITAGIHNAADVRMILGLFILGFGPALLAGAFRGLRRPAATVHHEWWERLTDLAIAPFLGGWATKGMVEALPALAGVKLPIADHATAIAWTVAIALGLRVILEEVVARLFPGRLNFIHPTEVPSPSNLQKVIALTMRAGIFFFVAGAFIGTSWHLYAGTFLFIAPSYVGLFQDRFPNYPKLYQILPAGLPGLAFTLLVASASLSGLTAIFGATPDLAKIAFVLLPIPSVILSALGMFGREPAEGDVRWYQREKLTWLYRLGGIAMLIYTMRLTGII